MTLTLPSSNAGAPPAGLSPTQSLARNQRIFASLRELASYVATHRTR